MNRFYSLLLKKIQEEQEKRLDHLAQGGAKDYAEYRESAGYLLAIKDILALCEDVNREILGDR